MSAPPLGKLDPFAGEEKAAPLGTLDPWAAEDLALAGSIDSAQAIKPEAARSALDAARRAGIPSEVALRRSEEVGADLRRRAMPVAEIAASPVLSEFFSHPVRAASAQDHARELLALRTAFVNAKRPVRDIMAGRLEQGRGNVRLGDLVAGRMRGTLTPEEAKEWETLKLGAAIPEDRSNLAATAILASRGNREAARLLTHSGDTFLTPEQDETRRELALAIGGEDTTGRDIGIAGLGSAVEQAPMMARGGIGGAVGFGVPAAFGAGALALGHPEAAAIAAAVAPWTGRLGAGAALFPINLGESYANLEGLTYPVKGHRGVTAQEPVPQAALNGFALAAAAVKTGLDVAGFEALLGVLPGGAAIFQGPVAGLRARVTRALAAQPELVQAFARFGATYLAAVGTEAGTEAVQTAIDLAARAAVAPASQGELGEAARAAGAGVTSRAGVAEIKLSAAEAARASAVFGAAGGAVTGAYGLAARAARDRRSRESLASIEKAADALEEMRGSLPADFRELAQRLAEEQGVETAYMSPEDLTQLFQQEPDRWRTLSPETQREIAEAAETGRVAAIPMGEYLAHLRKGPAAPAEGAPAAGAEGARGAEVRLDPYQLTEEEGDAIRKELGEASATDAPMAPVRAPVAPAAEAYFVRMRDALESAASTPYDRRAASVVATMMRQAVVARAERLGIPLEQAIAEEPALAFVRRELPAPPKAGLLEAPIVDVARVKRQAQLTAAIADLREGKVAAPKQKTPVLTLLRKLGGIRADSPAAGELRNLGVTPKSAPGIFRKRGGAEGLDNVVRSEHPILAYLPVQEGTDYIEPQALLDAVRDELAGKPLLTEEETAARMEQEGARAELGAALAQAKVDIAEMADEDAARLLLAFEAQQLDETLFQGPATDSEAFRRWFGESKVVDAEGKPLVVYHETRAESVAGIEREGFDLSRPGARASDWGVPDGVFLKPSPKPISLGGANATQVPLYASIEKPLHAADRDALGRFLEKDERYRELARAARQSDSEGAREFEALERLQDSEASRAELGISMQEADARVDEFLTEWGERNDAASALARARATEYLREKGFDGVILENDAGSFGRSTKTFIALEPTQVKSATRNRGTFDPNEPSILYQSAYHGTPHPELEGGKFKLEKLGTGEGAQVYGHGLYFAEARSVAEHYRHALRREEGTSTLTLGDGRTLSWGEGSLAPDTRGIPIAVQDFVRVYQDRLSKLADMKHSRLGWLDAGERDPRAKQLLANQLELIDARIRELGEQSEVQIDRGAVAVAAGALLTERAKGTPAARGKAALEKARATVDLRLEELREQQARRARRDPLEQVPFDPDDYGVASLGERIAYFEGVKERLAGATEITHKVPGQVYEVDLPEKVDLLDYDELLGDSATPTLVEKLSRLGHALRTRAQGTLASRIREAMKGKGPEKAASVDALGRSFEALPGMLEATRARRAADAKVAAIHERLIAEDRSFAGVPELDAALEELNHAAIVEFNAVGENANLAYRTGADVYSRLANALGSEKAASEALREVGIPGLHYLDEQSRRGRSETRTSNFVIWDEDAIKVVQKFYQERAGVTRGSISFTAEMRDALIRFTEAADLSTGLHELGHYYTLRLEAEARSPDAPEWMAQDAETLRTWAGAAPGEPMTTEQKEKLADGFLAYLREGRAPSEALRGAFARMREWLVALYRSLRDLLGESELTDEVRAVFDRLLATDAELERQRAEDVVGSIFAAEQLTDAEQARLQKSMRAFDERVRSEVDAAQIGAMAKRRDLFSKITREREAARKGELDRLTEEAAAELAQQPVWQADTFLRSGKVKLSKPIMLELFGADSDVGRAIQEVPTGARSWLSATEGVHPDEVAEQFGFDVGAELVRALVAAGSKEAGSLQRTAGDIARARLRATGNLSPGAIEEAALRALAGEARIDFLIEEERILAAKAGTAPTPRAIAEEQVRRIMAEKQFRDLRPDVHRATARRARREALLAVRAEDYRAAAAHLRREMLHTMLEQATRAAREEAFKILTDLRRADRDAKLRKRVGKAMGGYLEAMDALLEQTEIRVVPLKESQRRTMVFAQWVAEHRREGDDLVVPDWLLEYRRRNWRTLTLTELRGLHAAVETVIHNATEQTQIRIEGELREREEVVDELVAALHAEVKRGITRSDRLVPPSIGEPRPVTGRLDRFFAGGRAGDAMLTKKEHLIDFLARGDTRGIWHRAAVKPLFDADDAYRTSRDEYRDKLKAVLDRFGKENAAALGNEVDERRLADPRNGRPFVLTRWDLLSIALNSGNESNFEKLVGGYEWNPDNVRQVLDDHLTEAEWQLVQDLFDLVETLWPSIVAQQRAVTGIIPNKVEAKAIETKFGQTLRGGYWPVVYDPNRSVRASVYAEAEVFEKRANGSAYVETDHGFTEARTALTTRALQLDGRMVLERHLDEVLLDLAFRPALLRTSKLLRDERLNQAMREALGPEFDYARFWKPWLQWIAGDTADTGAIGLLEKAARNMRLHATAFKLGLRLSTLLVQPTGLAQTVGVLGGLSHGGKAVGKLEAAQRLARGLWNALGGGSPKRSTATLRDIAEASPFMRDRPATLDHDLRDLVRDAAQKRRVDLQAQAFAAKLISGIQYFAADVPTWLAAREIARERMGMTEAEAIAFADSRVRLAQGGGSRVEVANIVNGSEFWKQLNLFYTFRSNQYNLMRMNVRARHSFASFLAAHTIYIASGAIASVGIMLLVAAVEGREPPDDWEERAAGRIAFGELAGLLPFGGDAYQAVADGRARAPGAIGLFLESLADLGSSKSPAETFFDTVRWFGLVLGAPLDWPAVLLERRTTEDASRRGSARGKRRRGGRAP